MTHASSWWRVANADEVDSPALLVFPERVKQNIQAALRVVADPSLLRPHIKTNKSPDACRLMLEAGIDRFKCATIAEAEMLGQLKAPDVLLAYAAIGPKQKRLASLVARYPGTRWSCLVDEENTARALSDCFSAAGLMLDVYLDLNVGMNRTGIVPGEEAINLYRACAAMPALRPVGLHAYDGHIRDADLELRKKRADEAFARVAAMAESITAFGMPSPILIAGGSPTFLIHARRKNIVCSPGTFIYWDKGYADLCPDQPFVPAVVLLTRIISLPAPGTVCADLGHKSVGAENEIGRRLFLLNGKGLTITGQSEEHLVMQNDGSGDYRPGDCLYAIPYHVCPTVALYERMITVTDGRAGGEWKNLARDRKLEI